MVSTFAVSPGTEGQGTVVLYNGDATVNFTFTPDPALFGQDPRGATADINGDGTADLIVGSGIGVATRVQALDGVTHEVLHTFSPFESRFTGGVFLAAADFDGDGKADVVVTPDQGGPSCEGLLRC